MGLGRLGVDFEFGLVFDGNSGSVFEKPKVSRAVVSVGRSVYLS